MELHGQAPRGSIGHGLGLRPDEPPIILGPEDEAVINENMIFSIEINPIGPAFGAIGIEEDIIFPPNAYGERAVDSVACSPASIWFNLL